VCATLAANMPSNVATSSAAVGPHAENPALLTRRRCLRPARKPPDLCRIAKVGCVEARLAAGPFNLLDGLRSAPGVASVHDHLEAVGGQLHGDRAADTGRRSGHECSQGKTSAMSLLLQCE